MHTYLPICYLCMSTYQTTIICCFHNTEHQRAVPDLALSTEGNTTMVNQSFCGALTASFDATRGLSIRGVRVWKTHKAVHV